jgi:hypothetical protein
MNSILHNLYTLLWTKKYLQSDTPTIIVVFNQLQDECLCIFCSHFALWMTISPSGNWIWQNRHRRWIRNAQNSRNRSDFVETGSEMGWTGQKTDSVRRAVRWGWTGNILLARLAARLGGGLGGSMRLKYGARVAQSSSTSGRVGCSGRIFRRRV